MISPFPDRLKPSKSLTQKNANVTVCHFADGELSMSISRTLQRVSMRQPKTPLQDPHIVLYIVIADLYILALRGAIVLRSAFFSSVSSINGSSPFSLICARNSWPYL